MPKNISVLATMILTVGCAVTRPVPQTLTDDALCSAYGVVSGQYRDRVKAEIQRRKLIPDVYWKDINANNVTVGMPKCAVQAAFVRDIENALSARRDRIRTDITREPSLSDRFGSSVGASGVH